MNEDDEVLNPNEEENQDENFDNVVVLTDENGVDTQFEFLDLIECDGKDYVILLPVETADDGEVVIFRIEQNGDEETYVGVETEEEAAKVFAKFKEKAKDDFNFVD